MNNKISELTKLKEENSIEDIDLEFCRLLLGIEPDIHPEVLLAAGLTSYAYRQGNICISLQEHAGKVVFEGSEMKAPSLDNWVNYLEGTSVVGRPGDFCPLILDESRRLYLHKLWHYEQSLAQNIMAKARLQSGDIDPEVLNDGIKRLFHFRDDELNWQAIAAIAAVYNNLTVISGGPGTGKTTTVVNVLALLLEQNLNREQMPSIALAAPTGKAAARMEDSILSSKENLNVNSKIKEAIPGNAMTIHQLLGARRNSSQFRYNEENPLPYDVVIIDEASMVDQALMSRLMEALLHDAKLILIGDKDQLASVEAGSVLGSICNVDRNRVTAEFAERLIDFSIDLPSIYIEDQKKPLTDSIILLEKSYRFKEDSGIPKLAAAINRGEAPQAFELLDSGTEKGISFADFSSFENFEKELKDLVLRYFRPVIDSANPEKMFNALKSFRLLSPHRRGPLGVDYLNQKVEDILISEELVFRYEKWYHGRPIIINQNEYSLNLNNGDVGICFHDTQGDKKILFPKETGFMSIAPSRLPDFSNAFSLTVHKSQGSEFDHVKIVLPDKVSPVLTRELLYTAVTRARRSVEITGKREVLTVGIKSRLQRSSGLKDLLWEIS